MYDFHGQLIPEPGGEELVAGETITSGSRESGETSKKWLLSYQTSVTGNSAADVVDKYCLLATVSYYSTRVSVSLFQTVVMLCEV